MKSKASAPVPCSAAFARGYFCAVAVFLKENYREGVAGTDAESLFRQGGSWKNAAPEDIAIFRVHGLIPKQNAKRLAHADENQYNDIKAQ